MGWDSSVLDHLVDQLAGRGFAISDALLDTDLVRGLAADAKTSLQEGAFAAAAVGKSRTQQAAIRGDSTLWIEQDAAHPVRQALLDALEAIRVMLNRELMLGLDHVETHYAAYPPGAFYARHRDRFRDDDARVISFTCYLNEAWREEEGGCLRLYAPEPVDVLPVLGRCTLFRSDTIEHEVLPATRMRFSIAGWFRRRTSPPPL